MISFIPRLFALPQDEKDRIAMRNSPHFLGYSRLGTELTKGATDQREQFDFASPHKNTWVTGSPNFLRLWGDAQAGLYTLLELGRLVNVLLSSGPAKKYSQGSEAPWRHILPKLKT